MMIPYSNNPLIWPYFLRGVGGIAVPLDSPCLLNSFSFAKGPGERASARRALEDNPKSADRVWLFGLFQLFVCFTVGE